MQLGDDWLAKWEDIVDQVDKERIPLECVKKIVFRLGDSKRKTINFSTLRRQSLDIDTINTVVEKFIVENDDNIRSMEFIIDIEAVAAMVQPVTDKLLKGI